MRAIESSERERKAMERAAREREERVKRAQELMPEAERAMEARPEKPIIAARPRIFDSGSPRIRSATWV